MLQLDKPMIIPLLGLETSVWCIHFVIGLIAVASGASYRKIPARFAISIFVNFILLTYST